MPDLRSEGNQGRANRGRERMDTHLESLELSALVPAAFPLFFHALDGDEMRICILWLLRAKDPKVRRAWVCETVAGLVLQVTQVTNAAPWLR